MRETYSLAEPIAEAYFAFKREREGGEGVEKGVTSWGGGGGGENKKGGGGEGGGGGGGGGGGEVNSKLEWPNGKWNGCG